MPTVLDRLQEALLIVFALYLPAMAFVDRAQWRSRLVELLGNAKGIPVLWRIPIDDPIASILYFSLVPLYCADAVLRSPATHAHVPWQLWQGGVLAIIATVVWVPMGVGMTRGRRWQGRAEALRLSRGALMLRIRRMANKTGIFRRLGIYVLPDMRLAWDCAYSYRVVLVPRQLLDSMSRREIDALAAWQLCRQSKQYYAPPSWTLLACDAVAVCMLDWLKVSPATRWIILLAVLAAQFAALAIYLPHALAEADRRAVDLTGDPEAFVSAMAGLSRFSYAPMREAWLQKIAARSGVAADRIPALLAERIAPAEDRYPTSGPYVTTGLP